MTSTAVVPQWRLPHRYATIRWLCDIQRYCRFAPDTLHLAVALFDRYMSAVHTTAPPHRYRLHGFTALWIALKYDEERSEVPLLDALLTTVKNPFDTDTVRSCERLMYDKLMHCLDHPTDMLAYGRLIDHGLLQNATHRHLVMMLLDIALFHRESTNYTMWHRACAALFLARILHPDTSLHPWSVACAMVTRCSQKLLTPIAQFLYKALENASSVIRKKYTHVFPTHFPTLPL